MDKVRAAANADESNRLRAAALHIASMLIRLKNSISMPGIETYLTAKGKEVSFNMTKWPFPCSWLPGAQGVVYEGIWQGAAVAVKFSIVEKLDTHAWELLFSKMLSHPNVRQWVV